MSRQRRGLSPRCLLAPLVFSGLAAGQAYNGTGFDGCKARVKAILDGTLPSWKGIDNATIQQFLYKGPVRGMNPEYERLHRSEFLTITTEGIPSPGRNRLCEE